MADKYNLGTIHQGILATEIYNGKATSTTATYNLTESYKNFKFLLVFCEVNNGTYEHSNKAFAIVDVSSVDGNTNEFRVSQDSGTLFFSIQFNFKSNTTFNISSASTGSTTPGWTSPCIYKIVGIN